MTTESTAQRARSRLPEASARELIDALARGEFGATELCEAAIERIERLDGSINAVVVRDFERAREQAARADDSLRRGERRPLLGLPMTVKEAFDVAGLPTTWGHASAREHRATEDAVAVQRLRAAGAVILGKTNVSVDLRDWQSFNPVYGRTRHPLDPERTPGGSSGGSAAAVASGMVPLELGSDIGGSIRVPASFCGVYGHKPTYGLLPARGHQPAESDGASDVELAVIGPLARTVGDLQLALQVLAGPDVPQAVAYRLELPAPRTRKLAGARLLLLTEHPSASTAPELQQALHGLAEALEAAGAVVAYETRLLPDLWTAHRNYVKLLLAITTRAHAPSARSLSASGYLDLLDERVRVQRRWAELFSAFDGVIAPAFGTFAFEHVEVDDWSLRTLRIGDRETPYGAQLAWPGVATFPGLPATAFPIGKTASGLPLGAQLIGPYLEDLTPLALVTAIAQLPARR